MNITDNVIPICYRCDNKYSFFLKNSIHSVLKHYTGNLKLHFYVCTNEESLNVTDIDILRNKYNFDFTVINVNTEFFNSYSNLSKYNKIGSRKYFSYINQFHWQRQTNYNETVYKFNPFNRSKTVIILQIFFVLTTHYKKVITLDTDTIVVESIDNLFNINLNNKTIGACRDWIEKNTYSPSVTLIDTERFINYAYKKNGLLERIDMYLQNPKNEKIPIADTVQDYLNILMEHDWLEIDRSWNVPITHRDEYIIKPKLYHFSESWNGFTEVHNKYFELITKVLQ
jgi:lipopolysaccharide biosynthesis glycosyltransferase